MEIVQSYAVRRKDGAYVNIHWEPVKSVVYALRDRSPEALNSILHGHYRPSNPQDYYLQPITITYQEDPV